MSEPKINLAELRVALDFWPYKDKVEALIDAVEAAQRVSRWDDDDPEGSMDRLNLALARFDFGEPS